MIQNCSLLSVTSTYPFPCSASKHQTALTFRDVIQCCDVKYAPGWRQTANTRCARAQNRIFDVERNTNCRCRCCRGNWTYRQTDGRWRHHDAVVVEVAVVVTSGVTEGVIPRGVVVGVQYMTSYRVAFLSPLPVTMYLSSTEMSQLNTDDDSFDWKRKT